MAMQSVQLGDRGARGQNAHVCRLCTRAHTHTHKTHPGPTGNKAEVHGGGRSQRINGRQNETFKERKVQKPSVHLLLSRWLLTGWGYAFAFSFKSMKGNAKRWATEKQH